MKLSVNLEDDSYADWVRIRHRGPYVLLNGKRVRYATAVDTGAQWVEQYMHDGTDFILEGLGEKRVIRTERVYGRVEVRFEREEDSTLLPALI